ncbi:MAG: hybrid sensor histidine kinase/response regulator [Planctomycetaceae bacterium]|nr:hybrid sensor histidine kinase/response regulator [Planctomycetaceae bacterium]
MSAMDQLRVLVVDDEPGMRRGVARALRNFTVSVPNVEQTVRFQIDEAESGEVALAKIAEAPPEIMLLDHKMPGISGLDVLHRVAAMKTDILTVMITAYASIETAVAATKQGAYDFLAKPFTPDELRNTVRKATVRIALAREARKLADERRQVRFQFIRVLGHELKSPLSAVDGFLQLLQNRSLGDDLRAYEEVLRRGRDRVQGMHKLIADLLDMTRIESGQKERTLETIDLVGIARSAIELQHAEAERRGIVCKIQNVDPVPFLADRGEMEMVFNNLVSNAVKYNRDRGRVEVAITAENGQVQIRVADTGIGLTEKEAGKLFGEFIRIKNEKTRNIHGSGLGLSIVKKIAELYRGDVSVSSRPGEGSTFCVCLAAVQDVPQQLDAEPTASGNVTT